MNGLIIKVSIHAARIPLFIRQLSKREPAKDRSARCVGNETSKRNRHTSSRSRPRMTGGSVPL